MAAVRRWSGQVTAHGDALDLKDNIFTSRSPRSIALSLIAVCAVQPTSQGRSLSLGNVYAHFLHKSGRQESDRVTPQYTRTSEASVAAPIRTHNAIDVQDPKELARHLIVLSLSRRTA
jgi:Protein of unknown function (DUF3175)